MPKPSDLPRPRDAATGVIGWRRFAAYAKMRTAAEAAALLLDRPLAAEATTIDDIGRRSARTGDRTEAVDALVAQVMALDIAGPGERLRTAAARALSEAERFADLFADRQRDLAEIAEVAASLRRDHLDNGLMDKAHLLSSLVGRWGGRDPHSMHDERQFLAEMGAKLEDLARRGDDLARPKHARDISEEEIAEAYRDQVEDVVALKAQYPTVESFAADVRAGRLDWIRPQVLVHEGRGRRPDLVRRFLLLRLAEVYALLGGREPDYYVAEDLRQGGAKATPWLEFLGPVLAVLNFPHSGTLLSFDNALRDIADVRETLADLAQWPPEGLEGAIVTLWQLPSAMLMHEFRMPLWPGDQGGDYPPPRRFRAQDRQPLSAENTSGLLSFPTKSSTRA